MLLNTLIVLGLCLLAVSIVAISEDRRKKVVAKIVEEKEKSI
jgi:hypothetical protein